MIKKNLSIAKDTITIDPVYLLLLIEELHKGVIDEMFYKKFWQSQSILSVENFDIFVNILWNNKKPNAINHPFYEFFMRQIVKMKLLKPFWTHVDEVLSSSSKQIELVTIHSAVSIIKNLEDKPKEVIKILTTNFLKMLSTNGSKSIRDEEAQEMYTEFYELLDKRFQSLESKAKLQVIKTFIQTGSLTVEKNSVKKIITNLINSLELEGLHSVVIDIKETIVSEKDDRERQYATTILQKIITGNKLVASDIQWRIEQLIFLVNLAFFKSPDGVKLSTKEEDIHSNAINIKNIFYHCLEYKLPNLEDEKTVLLGIVNHINNQMNQKDPNKHLQKPLKANHLDTWKKMYSEVTKKVDKKDKKLKTVFQVLMLHMGLQLFNHSDVAENAIAELEAVTNRALKKKSSQNEPDWIEVVVDLFLNLLSQESHLLRNVIRHVFPQLCSQMTVTAFHQILALLDLKSEDNPLQVNGNENDDEMETDSENEGDEDEDAEEVDSQSGGEESNEDEENEENEEDSDVEIEDEQETVNDSMRLAIQTALGAAAGGDGDDIDVDEMDEAEGAKLDMALADAFKMLKQNRKKKITKADKIAEKTLLHFRMRALDLVEIYLKNNPQMEICLETLIFFYDLMPVVIKNEKQSPLLPRFDGIFMQLAQLKSFSLETVANVTSNHLAKTLTDMLEKTVKEKTNIQQLNHFARACIFLINCSQILQKLTPGEDEVLRIMLEHLREFFTHRNPTLQLNSFNKILATQWSGNFKMAKFISDEGLKKSVRSLRRTQSLQMLKTFFKNYHLLTQDQKHAVKYTGKICEHLKIYASEVLEVPQPEFLEILQFVLAMRQQKDFSAKDELVAAVQRYRSHLQLKPNILIIYKSFCNIMKITFVPNEKVDSSSTQTNGVSQEEPEPSVNGDVNQKKKNGNLKRKLNVNKKEKKLKKKQLLALTSKNVIKESAISINSDVNQKLENGNLKRKLNISKKAKKLKKQQRLQEASKGINSSFSFADTREEMLE